MAPVRVHFRMNESSQLSLLINCFGGLFAQSSGTFQRNFFLSCHMADILLTSKHSSGTLHPNPCVMVINTSVSWVVEELSPLFTLPGGTNEIHGEPRQAGKSRELGQGSLPDIPWLKAGSGL